MQVLFDVKACTNGLHDGGKLRGLGSTDQVKGQLVGIVEAATEHQEVASVLCPGLHPGEHRPVKEAFPFGALALAKPLPVAGLQVVGEAADIAEQAACFRLHADHLGAGNGKPRRRSPALLSTARGSGL